MDHPYSVYILQCSGNRYYTGIARDVYARFTKHCSGKGAAFTRAFKPTSILLTVGCESRSEALKLEAATKKLPKSQKLDFLHNYSKEKDV